jgi:hypothetical protein
MDPLGTRQITTEYFDASDKTERVDEHQRILSCDRTFLAARTLAASNPFSVASSQQNHIQEFSS